MVAFGESGFNSMKTQLVRLQLLDGDPAGLRNAAMAGRTTLLYACPWTQIQSLMAQDEAKRTAVYILAGVEPNDAAGGQIVIYVGECDSLVERFAAHHKKDAAEWTEIFLATTTDGAFNKTHARYAEHWLVQKALITKQSKILNGGTGPGKLDIGDQAFAEDFARNVSVLAQTLGLGVFRQPLAVTNEKINDNQFSETAIPTFEFKYTNYPVAALMVPSGNQFVIKAGSLSRATDMAGLQDGYRTMRANARKDGILIADKDGYERFTIDFPTPSTSAAGSMIYGSACAGPVAWYHVDTKESFKDWQARQAGETL